MDETAATFTPLLAATALFVASHFLLSARSARDALVRLLTERGFLLAYSLLAGALFVWMNLAYARAPFEDLWGDPLWARWAAVALMPVATVFLVAGVTTASPAAVGGDRLFAQRVREPVGIQKVTRHPVLWALAIWAALHLAANGDLASAIFFGGLLALCLGGMAHIESRRRSQGGANWAPFAAQSSALPFAAVLAGRARVSHAEIGWSRIATGLGLYLVFLFGHRVVIDVPILPGLAGG